MSAVWAIVTIKDLRYRSQDFRAIISVILLRISWDSHLFYLWTDRILIHKLTIHKLLLSGTLTSFFCPSLSLPCYPILPSPFFSLSYHFLIFSLSSNTMEPGTKPPLRELPINFPALEYWIVSLCLGNASQSATSLLPLDPMVCWKLLQHLTLSSLSQPTSSSGTTDTFN